MRVLQGQWPVSGTNGGGAAVGDGMVVVSGGVWMVGNRAGRVD